MISQFPLGFPYYNRYSRYGYRYPYYTYPHYNSNSAPTSNFPNSIKKAQNSAQYNNTVNYNYKKNYEDDKEIPKQNYTNNSNNSFNCNNDDSCKDADSPLFQLFGINLYFDDILIICLIWFLYSEGVKDQELFIALILLLLS